MSLLQDLIYSLYAEESRIIEDMCEKKKASRGSILMEQGRQNQDLFFLVSGKIGVYRKIRLGGKVTAIKLAEPKAPVLIGEANLFLERERNASILVLEDSEYLLLPHDRFALLKKEHPEIAAKILEYAGKVVADRYMHVLDHFEGQVVATASSPLKALELLKMCLGQVTVCSADVAKKLFGFAQTYID